jgi:hypothetical protein
MKGLLRLYPRSWRRRYGDEMEALLDDTPERAGVALNLVAGAAAAYAALIQRNRVLSSAASFVNGICIAGLLQAIAFVLFIMLARGTPVPKELALGPFMFASVSYPGFFRLALGELTSLRAPVAWVSAVALIAALVVALYAVLMVPRWATELIRARR